MSHHYNIGRNRPQGTHERRAQASEQVYSLDNFTNAVGKDGCTQYMGNSNAFVLVKVCKRVENLQLLKEEQMKEIEKLPIGTKFWVRVDSKSTSKIDPPRCGVFGKPCPHYKMPVFNG